MATKDWQAIARQEFANLDSEEQADWLDLRKITERRV